MPAAYGNLAIRNTPQALSASFTKSTALYFFRTRQGEVDINKTAISAYVFSREKSFYHHNADESDVTNGGKLRDGSVAFGLAHNSTVKGKPGDQTVVSVGLAELYGYEVKLNPNFGNRDAFVGLDIEAGVFLVRV